MLSRSSAPNAYILYTTHPPYRCRISQFESHEVRCGSFNLWHQTFRFQGSRRSSSYPTMQLRTIYHVVGPCVWDLQALQPGG
jgi:hypothetical protein